MRKTTCIGSPWSFDCEAPRAWVKNNQRIVNEAILRAQTELENT